MSILKSLKKIGFSKLSVEEIKVLREKVDPLKIRKLEILSGKEREELLDEIIQKELAKQNKFPNLLI